MRLNMVSNADGLELPHGQVGELLIRGHSVMLGYWRDIEMTREAFRGGWFHSGDFGYAHEFDGIPYYFIAGRIKEIIIRGGRNLSPLAIEHQLAALAVLRPLCGHRVRQHPCRRGDRRLSLRAGYAGTPSAGGANRLRVSGAIKPAIRRARDRAYRCDSHRKGAAASACATLRSLCKRVEQSAFAPLRGHRCGQPEKWTIAC